MAAAATEPRSPERDATADPKSPLKQIALDECEKYGGIAVDLFSDFWRRRCRKPCRTGRSGCAYLAPAAGLKPNQRLSSKAGLALNFVLSAPPPIYEPPPSYNEAILDCPPDYTTTDGLAQAKTDSDLADPPPLHAKQRKPTRTNQLPQFMPISSFVDWDDQTGVTTHGKGGGNKKKKKNAGGGDWASDNEEKKDNDAGDGPGEGNPGEGNGHGGPGGDGGNDGGGDDGDDWAGWNTSKDKKKKKKGKGGVDEEEEEKKKKKEEEANNALSWADEVKDTVEDDWGVAITGKKKKEKKKKNDPTPVGDLGTSSFDDVNLLDDGVGAPKIGDLSFGESGKKDTGSNFPSFSGWNSSSPWGSKNTNTWSFEDSGTTATADTKTTKDTNPTLTDTLDSGWGFGSSKTKKKDNSIGAGFDFGDFGAGSNLDDYKIDGEDKKKPEDDFGWSTNKKDKKKKDKLVEEVADTTTTGVGDTIDTGDTWGAWGGTKTKSKKKGKGGELEDISSIPPPPPEPPSAAPVDDWLTPAATSKKKKGKKGAVEEVKTEPPVVVVPEPGEADDSWDTWGKKDKTKKKAGDEKTKDITKTSDPLADFDTGGPEKVTNDIWGFSAKKDKAKNKKGTQKEEPIIPETDFGAGADFTLKDTTPGNDDFWNSIGRSDKDKDKKKGKKDVDTFLTKDSGTTADESKQDVQEESWGGWATTTMKGKKTKKGALKEEIKDPVKEEPIVEATNTTNFLDDDLSWGGGWGASKNKNDKKSKDTKLDEFPTAPAPPPAAPDPPAGDTWGTTITKKGKKGDRKKGTTTSFLDPEPAVTIIPEPDPEPEKKEDDDWDSGWAGLSSKEKKKREKERDKKKKEEEEKKKKEEEQQKKLEEEEARQKEEEEARKREEDEAKKKEEEDKKNKKKGKTSLASKTKKEDIKPTPAPEPPSALDDSWGSSMWGSSTKKKGKKEFDVPPPVPTPPAMGLTPEPEEQEQDDWAGLSFSTKTDKKGKKETAKTKDKKKEDDFWGNLDEPTVSPKEEKSTKSAKEEPPSKTSRSIWGSTTKSTTLSKDREKEKIREKEKKEKEDETKVDDFLDLIDEEPIAPPPKTTAAKGKAGSKLSKTVSKSSDKSSAKVEDKRTSEPDALLDFGDGDDFDPTDAPKAKDKKTADDKKTAGSAWSFWGADSKKPGVNKEKEAKEISKSGSTNKKTSLGFAEISEPLNAEKQLEDAMDEDAEESPFADFKSFGTKSKMKSFAGKSTVAEKVKAFETPKSKKASEAAAKEKEREKKEAKNEPPPPPPEPQPEPPTTKKSGTSKLNRTSSATAKTATSAPLKKKDPFAAFSKTESKSSKDTVPGSFPDDLFDADLVDVADAPASPEKSKGKTTKSKAKKKSEPLIEDTMDDLLMDAPIAAAPPTPPPEPKPAKKERAKITKDSNASSWGIWGSAPKKTAATPAKKPSKSKDDADIVSPTAKEKPSLSRSKSTRTPKEKEKEESRSSGGSDKDKESKPRSKSSRQGSFAGFFGGAPPVTRTKSVRRPSATPRGTSRRQSSADVIGSGMPSPPPEDELGLDDTPEMNSKAAKLMGVGGKAARKSKGKKSAVPDPYAIDDDDMVVVNPIEDPVINAPIPKKDKREKLSRSKSKRESRVLSDPADDIVMVDGPSTDAPDVITGPDDIAFVERPRDAPAPLKRSNTTSSKKTGGGLMGLFGRSKSKQEPSKALSGDEAYGGSRRKRTAAAPDDDAKRARRSRRPEKFDENEGFTTDAGPAGNTTEIEDAEARREARRSRREEKERSSRDARRAELREEEERKARDQLNDKAATEARRAKIREAREKRSKGENGDNGGSASKQKFREVPTDREGDRTATEAPPKLKRRSTRNETEDERRARHKVERRSSKMESSILPTRAAEEEADRRERRDGRSSTKTKDKRKSTKPIADYFDSRNGGKNDPYTATSGGAGEDKTSSWVNSQVLDPPPPPPIEGTVLEGDPVLGPNGSGSKDPDDEEVLSEGEEKRRRRRADRRKSRAERVLGEEEATTRRRRAVDGEGGGKRSSEGGSDDRDRERERGMRRRSTGYGNAVGLTGANGGAGGAAGNKRQSWFKKIAGM